LQLRSVRYGRGTDELVSQVLERDYWSADQWESWKQQRLSFVLGRAASRVPYYRERWSSRRASGDISSNENLKNWPVLEKDAVRENARAFVSDDCNVRRMFHSHTSGTTGKPLDLWFGRGAARLWYAIFEARCRRWHGLSRDERWAILGGQLIVPTRER